MCNDKRKEARTRVGTCDELVGYLNQMGHEEAAEKVEDYREKWEKEL